MASLLSVFVIFFSLSFLSSSSFSSAAVICEDLPTDLCSFAVSSAAKRCVLESENVGNGGGKIEYQCKTSEVVVDRISDWIETDECVRACGVDRNTVGISSDSLLDPTFMSKLCSPRCYHNCPNIIDFYFNLAAGEGVFLPSFCAANRVNPHRAMAELLSSGAAMAPSSSNQIDAYPSSPAPSPSV